MNIGNEPSIAGGQPFYPQDKTKTPPPLRPEEIREFKNCTSGLMYKAGIPFAIFCNILSSWLRKSEKVELTPPVILKRGFIFFGNIMIGTFLMAPTCYYRLAAMRAEYLKKNAQLEDQKILPLEGTKPVPQSEDLSYSSVLELGEPQDSFSLDFTTPKLLTDDLDTKKPQSTTYEDLRARHRSSFGDRGSPLNIQTESPRRGTYSGPAENPVFSTSPPPPQKVVKKNIYGDDAE